MRKPIENARQKQLVFETCNLLIKGDSNKLSKKTHVQPVVKFANMKESFCVKT